MHRTEINYDHRQAFTMPKQHDFIRSERKMWPSPCVAEEAVGPLCGELRICYFRWRVRVLSRISSQMCCSWNLQMFLLRDGLVTDIHSLLYGPSGVMHLPTHFGETVQTNMMTRGVTMVIEGVRGPEMFFQPFPKSPCRPTYIFLFAIHLVTLIPTNYPTFLNGIIPFLGDHQWS